MQFLRIAAVLSLVATVGTEVRAEWFSINNAISQAVLTNPGVGEASANRRATEAELRQTQGTLLPQVRVESRLGPEKFDQQVTPPPVGNGKWLPGREVSVVVRQILFDTEVNAIVPVVVVGAAGFEPAGSLPRAPRPASSTCVPSSR